MSERLTAERVVAPYWVRLSDGTMFHRAGGDMADLAWRLRYAQDSIDSKDMFVLAGYLSTYSYMVREMTKKRRNDVCRVLQDVERVEVSDDA